MYLAVLGYPTAGIFPTAGRSTPPLVAAIARPSVTNPKRNSWVKNAGNLPGPQTLVWAKTREWSTWRGTHVRYIYIYMKCIVWHGMKM